MLELRHSMRSLMEPFSRRRWNLVWAKVVGCCVYEIPKNRDSSWWTNLFHKVLGIYETSSPTKELHGLYNDIFAQVLNCQMAPISLEQNRSVYQKFCRILRADTIRVSASIGCFRISDQFGWVQQNGFSKYSNTASSKKPRDDLCGEVFLKRLAYKGRN